jgi:hypothetical protein
MQKFRKLWNATVRNISHYTRIFTADHSGNTKHLYKLCDELTIARDSSNLGQKEFLEDADIFLL